MKKLLNILGYAAIVLVWLGAMVACGYWYPWHLAVGILTALLGTALFFLWRFSRIILVLEDDLGHATQALEEVNESMQQIIDMKLYFDTPEVQDLVKHVMESVRMAQFSVNKMISDFTDRSNQKFVFLDEEEPEPHEVVSGPQQQLSNQEGTVASVAKSTSGN